MIVFDLKTALFVLLLLLVALLDGTYMLLRRRASPATAQLPDAWHALDQLPFGVLVANGTAVMVANQAARQLLPDMPGTIRALGLHDAPAARSGQLTQPQPLRWWSTPLDESRTLLLLLDERESQRATRAQ